MTREEAMKQFKKENIKLLRESKKSKDYGELEMKWQSYRSDLYQNKQIELAYYYIWGNLKEEDVRYITK